MDQVHLDKEYLILSEIESNEILTQRELSSKLGVSVSTVNVLINKMAREGLVKINQVSKRQVLYMLTPSGLSEKAKKTVLYLKRHYCAIYESKEKIKSVLEEVAQEHDIIFVLMPEDEIAEIIKIAVEEFETITCINVIKKITTIENLNHDQYASPLLLYFDEENEALRSMRIEKLNLISVL